jgi:hypothetical protein
MALDKGSVLLAGIREEATTILYNANNEQAVASVVGTLLSDVWLFF